MRDEYDFSDAVKNPYAEKILQHGYAIVVNCGAAQGGSSDNDNNAPTEDSVAEFKAQYAGTSNTNAKSDGANGTNG